MAYLFQLLSRCQSQFRYLNCLLADQWNFFSIARAICRGVRAAASSTMSPEAATGLVKLAALAAGWLAAPTGPAGTSAARDTTAGPAGPASAVAVAPEANAATATAEPASRRVSLEGMRLRTVLKEDKGNLVGGRAATRSASARERLPAASDGGQSSGARDGCGS